MGKSIGKVSRSAKLSHGNLPRYEHWLVDNQVYFITARCRDQIPVLSSAAAKAVFWDRFDHYTTQYGSVPWVTSLRDNHYHTLGYMREGDALPRMMQRLHGSAAKLVNDLLTVRLTPFWRDDKGKEYFDGCIRNERQARLAYRYTLTQAVRHGIVRDWHDYPHTHVNVELRAAIRRALELKAFLEEVRYKRYLTAK